MVFVNGNVTCYPQSSGGAHRRGVGDEQRVRRYEVDPVDGGHAGRGPATQHEHAPGKVSNTPADQLRALLAESGLTLVPVRPAHVTADAISAPGDPSGQVQPVTPSSLPLAQWRRQLTKFCRIGVANSAKYA